MTTNSTTIKAELKEVITAAKLLSHERVALSVSAAESLLSLIEGVEYATRTRKVHRHAPTSEFVMPSHHVQEYLENMLEEI